MHTLNTSLLTATVLRQLGVSSIITNHRVCSSFLLPADLEKMNSLERISFLQEKLQDIRNHYLSLKSEVASIDRRRKRMKKKERESEWHLLYA